MAKLPFSSFCSYIFVMSLMNMQAIINKGSGTLRIQTEKLEEHTNES
uniref:Bm465 n=1 Tax=Brugia malayi TaxID=6279 RepID=A0A0J9XUE9_BRUMA|nr:Bm465 [Brugia malayi]